MHNYALIVSDIHENYEKVNQILAKYPDSKYNIFLGDYFDSYEWRLDMDHFSTYLRWLKELAADSKNILLAGNHDVHYFTECYQYRCTGFNSDKNLEILRVLGRYWWTKNIHWLQFVSINDQNILFSHAGINPKLITPYTEFNTDTFARLDLEIQNRFIAQISDRRLLPGDARGGYGTGGITWQDWDEEFVSVPGLRQVVGHTFHDQPQINSEKDICLDTGLNYVALLDLDTGDIDLDKV